MQLSEDVHKQMLIAFHTCCLEWAEESENGYHVDARIFKKGFEVGFKIGSDNNQFFGFTPYQIIQLKEFWERHHAGILPGKGT
jgi:hypothetical protein